MKPGTVVKARVNSSHDARTFTLGLDNRWRSGVWSIDDEDFMTRVTILVIMAGGDENGG